MALDSFLKRLGIRQNGSAELILIDCDASEVSTSAAGAGGLLFGKNQVTVVKNSSTKVFTFTLKNFTSARKIQVLGGIPVEEAFVRLTAAPTTSVVTVVVEDDAGTALDVDFQLAIMAFRKDDDR